MIKLEHTEIVGWEAAIRGMRNPMNSWEKSDSYPGVDCVACGRLEREGHCYPAEHREECEKYKGYQIGPDDHDLMMRLRNAGTDHRKFMRMIVVYVDITAPLYWWKEFDTYKIGTVANSCSTMHKIADKEFTLEDFSGENLYPSLLESANDGYYDEIAEEFLASEDVLQIVVNALNAYRNDYVSASDDLKLAKDSKDIVSLKAIQKKSWWQMIQLLPSSYNQRRTIMLNYEVLANIYKSRKDHKLDEWREFCQWIEGLPYSEIITGGMTDEETDKMFEEVNKILKAEYPKLNNKWPTACELCNANGHGDSDEEHCKKCQFYKYSKWAPDIIANAMAEAYGYPPIDPKKLDPAERTADTAKTMKDIMDKLNKKE